MIKSSSQYLWLHFFCLFYFPQPPLLFLSGTKVEVPTKYLYWESASLLDVAKTAFHLI